MSIILLLFLGLSSVAHSMSGMPAEPVLMKPVAPQACSVKLLFFDQGNQQVIPIAQIQSIKLIPYQRQRQDKGFTIKRWLGDTASQYKYIAQEKQQLKLKDYSDGSILLQPGTYQIKHNSVSGHPPSGYYGHSSFFTIEPGQEIINVSVFLYPAI